MPPAKSRPAAEDSRSDHGSTARERAVAAAAHARSKKNGAAAHQNGSSLKALALVSTETGNVVAPGQTTGVSCSDDHRAIRPDRCLTIACVDELECRINETPEHLSSRPPYVDARGVHVAPKPSPAHESRAWPTISHNGQEEREKADIEGTASAGRSQELQRGRCERDGCRRGPTV